MEAPITVDRLRFLIFNVKEKLWVKPLCFCLLSILVVFLAKVADGTSLAEHIPQIKPDSVETLLSIMASSMMVIATFSAGTMVNAYASASQTSTPRSLSLIISDDVSQNALSVFIGAFIYSAVALTAMTQAFFNEAGLFILFCLTSLVFAIVILTFIRWVDSVARLGRVGSTILKVEKATQRAIEKRIKTPCLGAVPFGAISETKIKEQGSYPVFSQRVGYIQLIDIARIQRWACENNAYVNVNMLPGEFVTPDKVLAYVNKKDDLDNIEQAYTISEERSFEADPRFGFVVLGEIGSRALSPAVNDHGTAISIIGSVTRLLLLWKTSPSAPMEENAQKSEEYQYDRVSVPELSINDLFDDAYTSISRDGAANIEVAIHIQKSLGAIINCFDKDSEFKASATRFAKQSFHRSEQTLAFSDDIERLRKCFNRSSK